MSNSSNYASLNEYIEEQLYTVRSVLEIGVESQFEANLLLRRLYTVIAISNNEEAREHVRYIEERYGDR